MNKLVKVSTFLIILLNVVCLFSLCIQATPAYPSPYYQTTDIVGMMPIENEPIIVSEAIFELDFLDAPSIPVASRIEKSARLKMTYDVSYLGSASSIHFSLPLQTKFLYLDESTQVLVNDEEIDLNLYVSTTENFPFINAYESQTNEDFFTPYRNDLLDNYEFQNEIEGYLYKSAGISATNSSNYVETRLHFSDIPNGTIFSGINVNFDNEIVNWTSGMKQSKGWDINFFSTAEVTVEGSSHEIEWQGGYFYECDNELPPITITENASKLSDYLADKYVIGDQFVEAQKTYLLYLNDQYISENPSKIENYNLISFAEKYCSMSLEFKVEFDQPQKQIEITMPIPIQVDYDKIRMRVLANPLNRINEYGNVLIRSNLDETINTSFTTYTKDESTYQWIIDGDTLLEMVYNNSAVDDLNEVLFPIFIFIRIIELINVAKYIAIGVACILIIRHIIRNRKKKQKG